ncbi:ABC transporter ATP-binding protein [Caenibacillus caldisaponilyticus]|uniref:ABC transporter ATP-binding protein n=1 Tax=Caenibacillus caldisaponilyticus TaxID=1674942 RepID=UPI00098848B6|nr:ABC transporter ATP-binding protein [Caenibacillus caldisaponilyticus]
MSEPLLKVEHLDVGFKNRKSFVKILDDVSFDIQPGETVCIVGESGCGKSLTSLAIMGLLPPGGRIAGGKIIYNHEDLTKKSAKEMSNIRGNEISMIFQEPMTSLNPVHTIGKQVAEAILIHQSVSKKEAWDRAIELLRLVGIPSPEARVKNYPHEMSGGMRQRVMIAMALACRPKLLIADEPTTALDVTIQAQILEQMNELKKRFGMAILMITHDLGVVSEMADKVIVMYAGKVVETTDTKRLFQNPRHPYTQGLIASMPRLDKEVDELPIIPGNVPAPEDMPTGCRFSTRCPFATELCRTKAPGLYGDEAHRVSCWMYTNEWAGGGQEHATGETIKL